MGKLKWRIAQWLELRWWQYYLSGREREEYLNWKKAYWLNFLRDIDLREDDLARRKLLDLGCGPAGLFTILKGQIVHAVDPLISSYEQKLNHFDRADYPYVEFTESTMEHFNSKTKYDFVFCLNAINHVRDIGVAFNALRQNTDDDGLCILSIDAHRFYFIKWLFRLVPGDALHPHQYDLKEYIELFERSGFLIEQKVKKKSGLIFDYYILKGRRK